MAKFTLKPGYAFQWDGKEWEIVVISEDVTTRSRYVGRMRVIDGAPCAIFDVQSMQYPGGHATFAQTCVMSQDPEDSP